MNLHIDVRVKFRAWGITFGTVERSVDTLLPIPPLPAAIDRILVDDRGVYIHIKLSSL